MSSEFAMCDEAASTSSDGDESYVQLPRRVVEQMSEMCRLFVLTATHLAQPTTTSTANHVSFLTSLTFSRLYRLITR